jgi:thymidylate synthase
LVDNGCNIWNGDAYKNYFKNLPLDIDVFEILTEDKFIDKIKTDDKFAKEWGELGPIYGTQWRDLMKNYTGIDQIQNLINDLKTNPDSRRLMVTAWNVGELESYDFYLLVIMDFKFILVN